MTTLYKLKTKVVTLPSSFEKRTIVMREITTKSLEILNDKGEWEPTAEYAFINDRNHLVCEEN